MIATRRLRASAIGAMLALVAVLGLVALTGWHHAVVHDDDPVHAVAVRHDHASTALADPDGSVHLLAHATGQWIAFAATAPTAPALTDVVRIWPIGRHDLGSGIDPSGLLRPPRG